MIKWSVNVFKADAEKVDAELQQIGDKISPETVLNYAKRYPDSELYKCFEWDDTVAAEKYRLVQARQVIQFLYEVPDAVDEPKIRRYSITQERNTYSPTRQFLVNKDEYSILLGRAIAELKAFQKRYQSLSELETVFDAIDQM